MSDLVYGVASLTGKVIGQLSVQQDMSKFSACTFSVRLDGLTIGKKYDLSVFQFCDTTGAYEHLGNVFHPNPSGRISKTAPPSVFSSFSSTSGPAITHFSTKKARSGNMVKFIASSPTERFTLVDPILSLVGFSSILSRSIVLREIFEDDMSLNSTLDINVEDDTKTNTINNESIDPVDIVDYSSIVGVGILGMASQSYNFARSPDDAAMEKL